MKQKRNSHHKTTRKGYHLYSAIPLCALIFLTSLSVIDNGFAQLPTVKESVSIQTDKNIYQYGETIKLTIQGSGPPAETIHEFRTEYAGFEGPCGVEYIDYALLQGSHPEIASYSNLLELKDKVLNADVSHPFGTYFCPYGIFTEVKKTEFSSDGSSVLVTFGRGDETDTTIENNLIDVHHLKNVYGETVVEKVSPTEEKEYVEREPIPAGQYTIVGFTMSGEISTPTVIEITQEPIPTSSADRSNTNILQTIGIVEHEKILSFASILPFVLGSIVIGRTTNFKSHRYVKIAAITAILGFGSILPLTTMNEAFAADWNVGTKGIEHRSTGTSFTEATVEDRYKGVKTTQGSDEGWSNQNNHFIKEFQVGSDWLWSQSVVRHEIPTSATFNSFICSIEQSSTTCKLPDEAKVQGVYNFWTHEDGGGNCPSGWESIGELCVEKNNGSWITVDLTDKERLDTNAFQEIRSSDGKIWMLMKYRTCTSSSCDSYFNMFSHLSGVYADGTNSYYGSQSVDSTTMYGTQSTVGECAGCNDGFGRVTFEDGTVFEKYYTINTSGSSAYRSSSVDGFPGENNDEICWWDSISSTGGSNPTFDTSAIHDTSCQS